MLIPVEKLKEAAAGDAVLLAFITKAEADMEAEVEEAKACLRRYGYKTYEDQKHEYHQY